MKNALQRKPTAPELLTIIDPGRSTGVAVFRHGILTQAMLVDPFNFVAPFEGGELVVEVPRVYGPGSPVDANDLILVACMAGWMAQAFRPTVAWSVAPSEWKGQRSKKVDNAWTMRLLSDKERHLVHNSTTKGKLNNVIDAVGIGLWAIGRRK